MEKTVSGTKYKLSEATYFLGQMQVTKENKDKFQYTLSAYISALRSVTYFMQKEYAHIPNFSGWYESKRSPMEADPMLVFFHKQRVRTTHKNQIATQPRYQIFSPSIDTTKITPESRISFALPQVMK